MPNMTIEARVSPRSISRTFRPLAGRALAVTLVALAAACAAPTEEAPAQGLGESESALAPAANAWGFAWVDATNPTIDSKYAYSSGGGVPSYAGANGSYVVTMPNLAIGGGNVQVAAYGTNPTRCKVGTWGPSGSNMSIGVYCHDANGQPAASSFVVYFGKGAAGQHGAHVWYDGSSLGPGYSWNSAGGTNTATPTAVGYTTVRLPNIAFTNAGVHVTAYGSDATYCKPVSWSSYGAGVDVVVRCNDASGAPRSSAFSLAYGAGALRRDAVGGHARLDAPGVAPTGYQTTQGTLACLITGNVTASGLSVTFPSTRFAGFFPPPSLGMTTAYGDNGNFCVVQNWSTSGSGHTVTPKCYSPSGAPVDTAHTTSLTIGAFPIGC
jgi:hypothetical protein